MGDIGSAPEPTAFVFGKRKTTTASSETVAAVAPYSTLGVKPDPYARRVPTEAAAAIAVYLW